jgi:LuxR family transcriptional regulator, maltose regulon positive regulatory protein
MRMNFQIVDSELTLKATPPRTPQGFIVRRQLVLDGPRFKDRTLILVEAPAGYGKSSVLVQWRKEALTRGAICAWLTLDERDTAERLVRGLHMARVLACGTAPSAVTLAQFLTPGLGPLEGATSWLADIAAMASEVVLFVDDVHTMPCTSAQELLAYVVLNSPANLSIVLASRNTIHPATFASLRSTPALVIAADLRLSIVESEGLMQSQMAAKPDPALATRLHELSGGWPLGLQLMVSTLRGNPDPDAAADAIAVDSGDIARYFRQCLDGRLSPEQMHFLLQVCIVDVVTPALCACLTRRDDAAHILQELCLVTPLFGESMAHGWFRMHALGLDFLRERARRTLPTTELDRLNIAASRWLGAHGLPEPAARHALAAGRTAIAFDLAEQCLPELLDAGDFSRILEWLERIPPVEAAARPGIASAALWTSAVYIERDAQAQTLAEAILDSPRSSAAAKEDAAAALLYSSDADDAPERGRRHLEKWPDMPPDHAARHAWPRSMLAILETLHAGRPEEARRLCERELEAPAIADIFLARASFVSILAQTHFWEGRADLAAKTLQPLAARATAGFGRRSVSATAADVACAAMLWELGEDVEAARLMADRAGTMERLASFRLLLHGHLTLARMALQDHNEARALSVLDGLDVIGQVRGIARLRWEALAEQVRIHAHAGRAKSCAQLLARLEAIGASAEARLSRRSAPILDLRLCISRAYAAIAARDFSAALSDVKVAAQLAADLRLGHEGIATQLLWALCLHKLGESHEAVLDDAVRLATAWGLRRIVRDTHPEIQALVDAARPTIEPARAEPARHVPPAPEGHAVRILPSALLTPKEREVLRHLAEGCANKRIGNLLGVTDETVKWHVKNLSAKLGGSNRRHVVDRARQMGIIA